MVVCTDLSNHRRNMKIGFLGPSGTFAEEAASLILGSRVAFDTISEVLDAV